ncbi:hypothetical protein B0H66DRAFT_625985 [Apodospora peruviana]|uniref:DOMON domain-containing protein n=1 Tax=Apodospora peruviana TaxID=516989 RepID=A0AAE0I139_9PEZI|nr:hypothetical protein B0H66DRAFT_625985 [Apodospora peruviana]
MQLLRGAAGVAAFLGMAKRQFDPDSKPYVDTETGLTFASYTSERGITFRVAIPDPVPADNDFETVLQLIAPHDVGWAGFAWGGTMTYNPLAIAWANGTTNVVLSSRIAYGYYTPPEYPQAQYTILKTGTHVNATHWQLTTSCKGCSAWGDDEIGKTNIDPQYQTTMAFAYSNNPVDTPASPESSFGIHDSLGHPIFDLMTGKNADFGAKITKLSGASPAPRDVAEECEE